MKNTIIWIIVIVVLLAGVAWIMNRPAEEGAPVVQDQQGTAAEPLIVPLSTQNASGMSGFASLLDVEGGVLVKLNLVGAPVGIAQPAHIHAASCANIGGVVYPLTNAVNGISETMILNVSLATILNQLPLALNVHKSVEEVSVYVACGDLSR